MPLPTPLSTRTTAEVKAFFDAFAQENYERHGAADRLLAYRLACLERYAPFQSQETVLDVGCGDGNHLFALAPRIGKGLGVDVSEGMIAVARERRAVSLWADRLSFRVDDAETLASVADASVDVVTCIGALEHMLDQRAVLASIHRVLRPGGRFVGLTLNGDYLWYRLADRLGIPTRHLSSDHRPTATEAGRWLTAAGFTDIRLDYWTFVPRGDAPHPLAPVLTLLDRLGHVVAPARLRGGLLVYGMRHEA